jgi:hypothetical protein
MSIIKFSNPESAKEFSAVKREYEYLNKVTISNSEFLTLVLDGFKNKPTVKPEDKVVNMLSAMTDQIANLHKYVVYQINLTKEGM